MVPDPCSCHVFDTTGWRFHLPLGAVGCPWQLVARGEGICGEIIWNTGIQPLWWSLHLSKIVKAFVFNLKKQREIMGNPFLFGPWAGGVFWDSVIFPDNRFLDEVNVVLTPKCRYDGDTTNKTNTIWVILVYLELLDLLPFFRAVSIGRNDVTKPSWRLGWPWTSQQLGILVHQKTGNSCTNVWNPQSLKLYMHHCVFSWWIPHVCYVNYPFYPFSIGNSPICIYNFVIYICIIYKNYTQTHTHTYIYIIIYIYMCVHYIFIYADLKEVCHFVVGNPKLPVKSPGLTASLGRGAFGGSGRPGADFSDLLLAMVISMEIK